MTWLTTSAFTEVWRLWAELDEALVDKLLYILEHNDDYPRHIVAYGLGRIGDRAAVPTLLHMLSDRNASVVMQAAHALGRLEILEAVPALIDLLDAVDSWYVQKACAEGLIWIGVGAAPALSKALEDNKLKYERSVVFALDVVGAICDQTTFPSYRKLARRYRKSPKIMLALSSAQKSVSAKQRDGQLQEYVHSRTVLPRSDLQDLAGNANQRNC